ncbi:MAG: NAD(P)H-dependent oxidoreductase [Flavobacterium sp.]
MKAIILLATLKTKGRSNTETLTEFLCGYLKQYKIDYEVIKLIDYKIIPGTYIHMEEKDDFPEIYQKILEANILLFATPLWWNSHSSELQRIIERLDEVYDIILKEKVSPLEGKIGGVIITGDSDGVEHLSANIYNFFNSMGIAIPPYTSLGVLWEGHGKNIKKTKTQLLKYYKKEYAKDAESMAEQLAAFGNP